MIVLFEWPEHAANTVLSVAVLYSMDLRLCMLT